MFIIRCAVITGFAPRCKTTIKGSKVSYTETLSVVMSLNDQQNYLLLEVIDFLVNN